MQPYIKPSNKNLYLNFEEFPKPYIFIYNVQYVLLIWSVLFSEIQRNANLYYYHDYSALLRYFTVNNNRYFWSCELSINIFNIIYFEFCSVLNYTSTNIKDPLIGTSFVILVYLSCLFINHKTKVGTVLTKTFWLSTIWDSFVMSVDSLHPNFICIFYTKLQFAT